MPSAISRRTEKLDFREECGMVLAVWFVFVLLEVLDCGVHCGGFWP